MKKCTFLIALAALLLFSFTSSAQNWQLVWQDEFTNGISSDWVFEIGNGSSGWGNNELQYYRRENATVENGQLVITAKRESVGGFNYTSARMKTQGRKAWKYGRIEARIAIPSAQGLWPAFWMLGNNINTVSWPACGEIDIMEHVNTSPDIHGTIHWQDHNGNYANYGGHTSTNVTAYHIYSVEWNPSSIKWYLDGVQYHEVNIANGINGTSEFHQEYFILLNMAVGGNWPGFTVDNNALPAKMYVDYVRVYQQTNSDNAVAIPGKVEAEQYIAMSGIQTETTTDAGGGSNVGWIDAGDWMDYRVNVSSSGSYAVKFRVASANGGGQLQLRSGNTTLGTINIPATGGWQNWTTLTTNVNLSAGIQTLRLYASAGGFNINWFDAQRSSSSFSLNVEAESYTYMSGIQTEPTSDIGGGQNVGWIDANDWMVYPVSIPATGTYKVEYRVASLNGGGTIRLDKDAGSTIVGTINVPATGGWQTWTTISHNVTLQAGNQNLGINAAAGGFNLNWFRISNVSTVSEANKADAVEKSISEETASELTIYPNPVEDELTLTVPLHLQGATVQITDTMGKRVFKGILSAEKVNVSNLRPGIYTIHLIKDEIKIHKRFIKN